MSTSRIQDQALRAAEVRELLQSVEIDVLSTLKRFRIDEDAATDVVVGALSAVASPQEEEGGSRIRFVEAVARAVAFRWTEEDPLEDHDAIH